MLIQRQPTAIRTLTVRTDLEAYNCIQSLSDSLNTDNSTLLRLAIADLLKKQKRLNAKTIGELINHGEA